MRAGRLKTRKYKTRRGGWGVLLVILTAALILYGAYLWREGYFSVSGFFPAGPTALPLSEEGKRESSRESREIVLPGKAWYALSLGDSSQENAARQQAAAFRGRGAAGYVYQQEKQFLVLGAAYESRADAQKVVHQLLSLHGIESRIEEISRPEITLLLSGNGDQLTALTDAYDLMDQAAEQMSALSQGLDSHTLTQQEIFLALSSQRDTALSLSARLAALFGPSPHAAVRQMISLLNELSQALSQAQEAQTATQLGAHLKSCQLLCICRMADCAAFLAG